MQDDHARRLEGHPRAVSPTDAGIDMVHEEAEKPPRAVGEAGPPRGNVVAEERSTKRRSDSRPVGPRVLAEMTSDWIWLLALAGAAAVAFLTLPEQLMREAFWRWVGRHRQPGLVLLAGTAAAQFVTVILRDVAAGFSKLRKLRKSKNRWPQRFVGIAETIGYSVAFATVDPEKVLAGAAAWIAFKQYGDWHRWKASDVETDEPRRRFFVFLFANAVQIGLADLVAQGLVWSLNHS
jgi:hypothetical protein